MSLIHSIYLSSYYIIQDVQNYVMLKEEDPLSTCLFNLLLDKKIRISGGKKQGMIYQQT